MDPEQRDDSGAKPGTGKTPIEIAERENRSLSDHS